MKVFATEIEQGAPTARFSLGKKPSSAAPAPRAGAMPRQRAANSNRATFRKDPVEKSVSKIILTLCHACVHTF